MKRILIGIGWFLLAYVSGGFVISISLVILGFHDVSDLLHRDLMLALECLYVAYIYLFYRVRTRVRATRRQFMDLPIVEPSIDDVRDIEEFYDKKRDLAHAKKLRRGGLI